MSIKYGAFLTSIRLLFKILLISEFTRILLSLLFEAKPTKIAYMVLGSILFS